VTFTFSNLLPHTHIHCKRYTNGTYEFDLVHLIKFQLFSYRISNILRVVALWLKYLASKMLVLQHVNLTPKKNFERRKLPEVK